MDSPTRPSVLQLILPFWRDKKNWKGWVLLILKLILMFGGVYIAVWSNELDGQVVDAMVAREWDGLWQVLSLSLGVSLIAIIVSLMSAYLLSEGLKYQWRSWMTNWFIQKWTQHCAYYGIERDASVDNADQRISQDIETFIQLTMTLTLGTLQVTVTAISFTVVLWHLSGALEFSVAGWDISIPGYMVYLAYAYAIGSLLISHYTGRQLIDLFNKRQTAEADFRYQGMQLRENAEQIAFYNGGTREQQRLIASFEDVKGNWRQIIGRTCKMMLARDMYIQTGSIIPTIAALPRYLSGAISLGDMTRITGAFNSVYGALSFFTQAYVGFAEWKAVTNRLKDLLEAINTAEQRSASAAGIQTVKSEAQSISSSALSLTKPNGELIHNVSALNIQASERWLIRGTSGTGKSTLLRAIAGIWHYGQGQVFTPKNAQLMFVPQRSYIPTGSLKSALCYPNVPNKVSDELCIDVLKKVQLGHLSDQLATQDRWQQKLSGGEQQRLAFARVLIQQPDYVFLDEATSGLDMKTEQALYATLLEQLPKTAVVSVAHRESLEKFHSHILDLSVDVETKENLENQHQS